MKKIYILLAALLIMVLTGCSGDNTTTSITEPSSPVSRAASQTDGSTSLITPVNDSGCIVDYLNGQIYGLAAGITSLEGYVNIASGYELSYTPTPNGFGTGTVVNVTNDGTIVESYTIIIFGDVNGDGNIDSNDAGMIVDYENYISDFSTTQLKAGDLNGDGNVDSNDAGTIVDVENYMICINQSTGMASSCQIASTGPAGGWIFYDKGSYSDGWRYLEAAPTDEGTALWAVYFGGLDIYKKVEDGTGTAIGTGFGNTIRIADSDTRDVAMNTAARICLRKSVTNGGETYEDWFLPSRDELAAMRSALGATPEARAKHGFNSGSAYHWSSSEKGGYYAWIHSFPSTPQYPNGPIITGGKNFLYRVRAIRSF